MKKYTFILALAFLIMGSCSEDILDKQPLNQVTEENFFKNANDLKLYLNGFYEGLVVPSKWALSEIYYRPRRDRGSDIILIGANAAGTAPFNQGLTNTAVPIDDNTWSNTFRTIRRINFLFANNKTDAGDGASQTMIGEAHYIRALIYFNFYWQYGAVPIITEPLNDQSADLLYPARAPRNEVVDFILAELDQAISLLGTKANSSAGRINKESALTLKSRVALYEGTWERYHQGSAFGVSGQDGSKYLEMVGPTVEQLIDIHGSNIFTGAGPTGVLEPYNQLGALYEMNSEPSIFLAREYNNGLQSGQQSTSWINAFEDQRQMSGTRRLVDMYLTNTGQPQDTNVTYGYSLNELGQNLDPRFRQTFWTPDRFDLNFDEIESVLPGSFRPMLENRVDGGDYPNLSAQTTGFRIWKSMIYDPTEYRNASTDDIVFRYAEALLNYAEAWAILGRADQSTLDKTVNVIRGRVNMQPMLLSDVNSWSITYDNSKGFDASETNLVNEIRRERTIELAYEGFRNSDLRRWDKLVDAIDGYVPMGANYSDFENRYNGLPNLQANRGVDQVGLHTTGLINPLSNDPLFQTLSSEGMTMAEHRYLSPIPQSQIDLYKADGKTLEQNPGWEGGPGI